ncbi:MAG: hypothetical protein U9Q70_08670 [Chloroflexota bacterium]|nr:hypothetical protein [Chloroflexota bacterium]
MHKKGRNRTKERGDFQTPGGFSDKICHLLFERGVRPLSILEPILVVGNPPWVTNAELMRLESDNLPQKTNLWNFSGLDSIIGKSNFDISEWMLIHILERIAGRDVVLAMLCKTSVARKVLRYAWEKEIGLESSSLYLFDAGEIFGVSVDACLLVCKTSRPARCMLGKIAATLAFQYDIQWEQCNFCP